MLTQRPIRRSIRPLDCDVRRMLPGQHQCEIDIAETQQRPTGILVECRNVELLAIPLQGLLDVRHDNSNVMKFIHGQIPDQVTLAPKSDAAPTRVNTRRRRMNHEGTGSSAHNTRSDT